MGNWQIGINSKRYVSITIQGLNFRHQSLLKQCLKLILKWVDEQCVPLVREITFNNAEEITEEGLPLMILFHKREATKDVDTFTQAAQRWLFSQKGKINIVTAQAEQV